MVTSAVHIIAKIIAGLFSGLCSYLKTDEIFKNRQNMNVMYGDYNVDDISEDKSINTFLENAIRKKKILSIINLLGLTFVVVLYEYFVAILCNLTPNTIVSALIITIMWNFIVTFYKLSNIKYSKIISIIDNFQQIIHIIINCNLLLIYSKKSVLIVEILSKLLIWIINIAITYKLNRHGLIAAANHKQLFKNHKHHLKNISKFSYVVEGSNNDNPVSVDDDINILDLIEGNGEHFD